MKNTRAAIVEIRESYLFKNAPYPSRLNFAIPENRAGYLGAFGQRHAYLTYRHLEQVANLDPAAIPAPDARGQLTVTVVGAGAAVELYGLCLFYHQSRRSLKGLRVNLIERVEEWKPDRSAVLGGLLKQLLPGIRVIPNDIDVDLTEDCISKLAPYYDRLRGTDLLVIYHLLNEIETKHASEVWKNLQFILKVCDTPVLVLVAEPPTAKAWPRVQWLRERLAECTRVLMSEPDSEVHFTSDPVNIELEGTGQGLNDRLFGRPRHSGKPVMQRSLRRVLMACVASPRSPVSQEEVNQQLNTLKVERIRGRFVKRPQGPESQIPLSWREA